MNSVIFNIEPSDEEIAATLAERLAIKDKELILESRRTPYHEKKKELAAELKRLNNLSREERSELVRGINS